MSEFKEPPTSFYSKKDETWPKYIYDALCHLNKSTKSSQLAEFIKSYNPQLTLEKVSVLTRYHLSHLYRAGKIKATKAGANRKDGYNYYI